MGIKFIAIIIGLIIIAYILYSFKRSVRETILAILLSYFWVVYSGFYNYSGVNFVVFKLNLFTFILWTAGLIGFKEIYDNMKSKYKFVIVSIMWIIFIISIEWIGYNLFLIQLATNYDGLFGLELIHLPYWGKLYYLFITPVFIYFSKLLGVK